MTTLNPVEELQAVRAIETLKYTYWRACDGKDPKGFRACFAAADTVLDYGPMGTMDADGMAGVFEKLALATVNGQHQILDMHHGFHPVIEVHSTTEASGQWTLKFRQVNLQAGTERVMTGEYRDTYVFEDGQWRIKTCTFRPHWFIERPLGDATVEEVAAG